MVRAPYPLATWMVAVPTPPAAPCTSTRLARLAGRRARRARTARSGSSSAAPRPRRSDRRSGSGKANIAGSDRPARRRAPCGSTPGDPLARAPACRAAARPPSPAKSAPSVNGGSGRSWYWPLLSSRSGNATPTECTSTSTSSGPGTGSSISRTSTPAGPDVADDLGCAHAVMGWPARTGAGPDGWSAGPQRVHLEVHRVGPGPVAAPGEAPLLEDRDHAAVDLADGAALVAGDVEVQGDAERVQAELGGAGDEPRVVAPGVLVGVDLAGEALGDDLGQRGPQLRAAAPGGRSRPPGSAPARCGCSPPPTPGPARSGRGRASGRRRCRRSAATEPPVRNAVCCTEVSRSGPRICTEATVADDPLDLRAAPAGAR